jgi:hypothetical protein
VQSHWASVERFIHLNGTKIAGQRAFLEAVVKLRLLLFGAVLFSFHAVAQDKSRVEVFGGYSHLGYYVYPAYIGPWTSVSFNGWEASGAFHLLPHLAGEAEISQEHSGNYPTLWTYMGGPHLMTNVGRVTIYGHVLFGALRGSSSYQANTTFAAAFGGGADVWFKPHIGVRIAQFDYLHTSFNEGSYFVAPGNHGSYRISTGVVVRF